MRGIGKKKLETGINKLEVQYKKVQNIVNNFMTPAKLPRWCGERPGKKSGEPSTPEEENVVDDADGNIEDLGMIEDVAEINEDEEGEEEDEDDEEYEYE